MMEWEEKAYKEIFESVLLSLKIRKSKDQKFSFDKIRGELKSLYISEENSWAGKSRIKEIELEAKIAAYEVFISEENKKIME